MPWCVAPVRVDCGSIMVGNDGDDQTAILPLEHAEDIEVQEECVELFAELEAVTHSQGTVRAKQCNVADRDESHGFGSYRH